MVHNGTDFGFEEVRVEEKADRVRGVFDSVAPHYDVMNDLMSLGIHRLWKRFAVETAAVRQGHRVLDLAGGTGDLARALRKRVGKNGQVVLSDINAAMVERGRRRMVDEGVVDGIHYVQADAEQLPFSDNFFNRIFIAFGLRNVTDKTQALSSMLRVLKPGGCVVVLEFSEFVVPALKPAYDTYSFKVLPALGEKIAGDRDAYRYLAESIRRHPNQEALKGLMEEVGFERLRYFNLSGGIAAVHRGYKL